MGEFAVSTQFALNPTYERKIRSGYLLIMVFAIAIVTCEIVIYLALSELAIYWGLSAVAFFILLPLILVLFLRSAKKSKDDLIPFINSVSDIVHSWACIGPSPISGGFEAHCELVDGYYLHFMPGLSVFSKHRGCVLWLFKFLNEPEHVFQAPVFKEKPDNKTLKATDIPLKDKTMFSWKESKERWKQLISDDDEIRQWMLQTGGRDVIRINVSCNDSYKINPKKKGEWLKGKALTVFVNFLSPASSEPDELKTFYIPLINIGKRIVQHIIEGSQPIH
jgi:hypothetical protein